MSRFTEEVGPTVGILRHRHFQGFFNVPVQAPTRGHPFYGYSEKPPHFNRLLRRALGYGGPILILNPRVPRGHLRKYSIEKTHTWYFDKLKSFAVQVGTKNKLSPFFYGVCVCVCFLFFFFFFGGGGLFTSA